MNKIIILQDTKEKIPWNLTIYKDVIEQKEVSLKTGDYTAIGLEDYLCIERKKTTGELSINLGIKAKQFEAELNRMQVFKERHIICEFPEEYLLQYPKNSGVPKYLWKKLKVRGPFLYKRLADWAQKYEVTVHFVNSVHDAQDKAMEIIRDAIKNR